MDNEIITMTPSEFRELKHSDMLMAAGFDALDEHLEHHGVLGQRKGVRNGPPYPLSPENHSAAEKKAGWRKSLASGGDVKKEKAEPPKVTIGGLFNHKKKDSKSETEKADEEEKKKSTSSSNSDNRKDPEEAELDRLEKEEAANNEPEKPKEMTPAERKQDMQDAVKSGDYERVQKYFSELTPDQISEAITRMDLQRNLNRYAPKEPKPQQPQQPKETDEYKEFRNKRNDEAVAEADFKYAEKHFSEMSNDQIQQMIDRLNYKKTLDQTNPKPKKDAMDRIDNVVKKLDKVNNWANSGIKWWNTAAKINNTFNENKWPMIDTNISTKFNTPANWASKLKAAANAKDDTYVENLKKAVNSVNNDSKQSNQTENKPNNDSKSNNQSSQSQNTSATSTSTTSTSSQNNHKKKHKDK